MGKETTKLTPWSWAATAALCCFAGGIAAGIVGSVLTALTWIVGGEVHPWVRGVGTGLLILTIPLLILAGYCMDWMERKPKNQPEETSRGEDGNVSLAQIFTAAIFLGVILIGPIEARSQQTIFSVPTTDVLERGKVYAQLDVSFKPIASETVGRFSSLIPRVVIGVGRNVEVGLNLTGNVQPGLDTTTLVPTAKWRPYQGKGNGLALVVGDNLFIPIRNPGYKIGNYFYVELSKTFESRTRVTIGGYHFTRHIVAPANRAGGQVGFEQPLDKKLTFGADWFTGKHSAGYFTPGLIFKPASRVTGYAGYSIGNQNLSRGNHFFLLEVGYNFN
ncbi:MAG: hypothetical protein M3539_18180 [Acidobacteriota bacterium]|nr:hypothetical protein [Acidobacteriota bacterium]